MDRKNHISFAPQGVNGGKNRLPKQIWWIAAAAVAFGLLSFFVILAMNGFDLSQALGKRQANPEAAEETSAAGEADASALQDLTDAVNFLVLCSREKELTFCTVVSVLPSEASFRVKPVSPDFVLETSLGRMRLSDAFSRASIRDITEGFAAKEIPIARYAQITEDNFISLLQKLGPVETELESAYSFSDGAIRYQYAPGPATLSAEAVLSFMKYAAAGEDGLRLQARLAASIIRTHFTRENVEKGEAFFSELINLVTTDVTVFDYTPAYGVLQALASGGINISVIS